MKKCMAILMLSMGCSVALFGCTSISDTLNSSGAIQRYSQLSTFKGLEVYVWPDASSGQVLVGMLEGTNRNKTEEDFATLYAQPVDLSTAKKILEQYAPDTWIMVFPIGNPLSQSQLDRIEQEWNSLTSQQLTYFWKSR